MDFFDSPWVFSLTIMPIFTSKHLLDQPLAHQRGKIWLCPLSRCSRTSTTFYKGKSSSSHIYRYLIASTISQYLLIVTESHERKPWLGRERLNVWSLGSFAKSFQSRQPGLRLYFSVTVMEGADWSMKLEAWRMETRHICGWTRLAIHCTGLLTRRMIFHVEIRQI